MPQVETETSVIIFNPEEGFLRVSSKSGKDIELEDAMRDFDVAAEMVNNTKLPVLADSRNVTNHTKEVREYYASKEMAENMTAMAILVDSLATRIIGNFFIVTNKPYFPTKLFTDEAEAVRWINEIIKKEENLSKTNNKTKA